MKIYSTDVQIWGTAYIRAENEEQALKILKEHILGQEIALDGELISGRSYDDPDLPTASLSPAATADTQALLNISWDIAEDLGEEK